MNLFEHLKTKAESPKSPAELAKLTGAEPELLARLLKHLAAMRTIYELDADKFVHTPLSEALTQSTYSDGFLVGQDMKDKAVANLHEYLALNKYRNPHDASFTAF